MVGVPNGWLTCLARGGGTESGFSYRGGTTGFVGIIQGAAVGRAASVAALRKVGIAITALSGVGALVSLQWRRVRHVYARVRSSIKKFIPGGSGSSSGSGSKGSSSSSSHSKKDKEKEREREGNSSRRDYAPPPPSAQPPVGSSSSSWGGSRGAAPPPPPHSSSSSYPYESAHAVTSPPASELEPDLTDAESIRSSRKSKSRKDKKDKDRKHRK